MVREREYELAETNILLEKAQKEKTRHMLRTTHELKAPFASIHANTQFLLKGYVGTLPDKAIDVLQRIATRCSRLTSEIQEMLQLANLRSASEEPLPRTELDLVEVLRWCITQFQPLAEEHGVELETNVKSAPIIAVEDYMKMLFGNLLSNAVNYSHKGGKVWVQCLQVNGKDAEVIIEDEGIGILKDKLPRIFEEYYRTDEAAQYNKGSSGLGLTIVEHVAQTHKIRVKVETQPGSGTKFTLRIPHSG